MKIAILNSTLGWKLVAQQLGIELIEVSPFRFSNDKFQLIIVNRICNSDEKVILNKLLSNGTNLLEINNYFSNSPNYTKFIKSIHPSIVNIPLQNEMIDINSNVTFYNNNSFLSFFKESDSIIYQLGLNIDEIYSDSTSIRKNFYSSSDRFPNEIVASNSKNVVRQIIQHIFQQTIKDYNFQKNESIFTFRIDTDSGSINQMNELYQTLNNYSIKGSWFIDVKHQIPFLNNLKDFKNQEIGIHCYEHSPFKNLQLRKKDIENAFSIANSLGLKINGITSPFGEWNFEINKLFEDFGFQYSSEFTLDYENYPFYPIVNNRFSTLLQLPVYPICIGSLRTAGFSEKQMIDYFEKAITQKFNMNEPICIYHHPTHRHISVLESIFQLITKLGILKLTYSEYSNYWKKGLLKFGSPIKYNLVYPANLNSTRNFTFKHKVQNIIDNFNKLTL